MQQRADEGADGRDTESAEACGNCVGETGGRGPEALSVAVPRTTACLLAHNPQSTSLQTRTRPRPVPESIVARVFSIVSDPRINIAHF